MSLSEALQRIKDLEWVLPFIKPQYRQPYEEEKQNLESYVAWIQEMVL